MTTNTSAPPTARDAAEAEEARYTADLARARECLDTAMAEAVGRLTDGWGSPISAAHPQYATITRLARDLVAAGFVVHDCLACAQVGGVCLTPTTEGVTVTWTPHDSLAVDVELYDQARDVNELMNYTLADVLCVLGWQTEPYGQASAHVVTGRIGAAEARDG